MNNVIKAAKLDLSLIKPYIKTICLVMLAPIAFTMTNHSLVSGISFVMAILSTTSSYTFSVAEKNGMERLYGILPIDKTQLVFGKYLCIGFSGLVALLLSLILHVCLLLAMSVTVTITDILISSAIGIAIFVVVIAFQIPGYYKYGSIKGRMFMFIPTLIAVAVSVLLGGMGIFDNAAVIAVLNNPIILSLIVVVILAAITAISVSLSVKIIKNKDM